MIASMNKDDFAELVARLEAVADRLERAADRALTALNQEEQE